MNQTIKQQIKKRISNKKAGSVFTAKDFSDISNNQAIRQTLTRLVDEGIIRRIARGVYDKPIFSKLLNEYEASDIYNTAKVYAKKFNWTIAPSGNTSLNLLGLSTQVSSKWSFVSDGPYKKYTIENNTVEFKHRTNREITGMSEKTILVIQALKALGKNQITKKILEKIKSNLSEKEEKKLLVESKNASAWIVDCIEKICKEK